MVRDSIIAELAKADDYVEQICPIMYSCFMHYRLSFGKEIIKHFTLIFVQEGCEGFY